jgi:single-strand DNA-binding protein
MTAQKIEDSEVAAGPEEFVNEVRLRGRLAANPEERELATGDTVVNLRVTVERPPGPARARQKADTVDCAVWVPRLKTKVRGWSTGDVVEVTGAIQRRFFRLGGATTSRTEVELATATRARRAASG